MVDSKLVPLFFQLLGHGFSVRVQTGNSVKELLCGQLGIHEDYLAQRIKTVFLNARVVDDVNTAMVDRDATLALSGAMPGLVGAIMRSGGFYAKMRSQISHEKDTSIALLKDSRVTLKLWNLVVKELGPTFLERGIWIQGIEVGSLIERHWDALKAGCRSAEIDEKSATIDHLQDITWKSELVFFQVIPSKKGS
jgi:uncharacterized membrane protein